MGYRFKDLTDNEIHLIKLIHSDKEQSWDARMKVLIDKFGVSERSIRSWISQLGFAKRERHEEISEQFEEAKKKTHNKDSKYYLITWAQNNTSVHDKGFKNMKAYAEFLEAEILVIAGRYRNPTSLSASKNLKTQEDRDIIKWSNELLPYLTANRHNIHKYLMILADVKAQPTAHNPLSGFEGLSGFESSILGHPKQHLKSLPILEGHPHKILMSTGAITKPNYTDSKAGKKGEFDHVYGFAVVEIRDEEVFHIRNVSMSNSGEFNDLFFNVKNETVRRNKSLEGIVLGDLHHGEHSEPVMEETFDLMSILKPKAVVLHDVFDGKSISHHHERDPFKKYRKSISGDDQLDKEIEGLIEYLGRFTMFRDVVIVRSNHDEHVDRYLRERDWKKDIVNSLEYMELATAILKGEAPNGIIPYKIQQEYPTYKCLGLDDSFMVKGVECAMHGDKGASGSRGSQTQFRKLNVRTITGHGHHPWILGGAFGVGTSTKLRLDYNHGLSPWMNSHVTIDSLGKRQQIMFVNSEYTTMKNLIEF